jgi:hypothetical protein
MNKKKIEIYKSLQLQTQLTSNHRNKEKCINDFNPQTQIKIISIEVLMDNKQTVPPKN